MKKREDTRPVRTEDDWLDGGGIFVLIMWGLALALGIAATITFSSW